VLVDEQQRSTQDARDQLVAAERRGAALQVERDEAGAQVEGAERARRQADQEAQDARQSLHDLHEQITGANVARRKAETELQALKVPSFLSLFNRVFRQTRLFQKYCKLIFSLTNKAGSTRFLAMSFRS